MKRGENEVVEHGESAEYKTQSLRAAAKMIFDDWNIFNRSRNNSHKNNKISKTTKLQQCSKFVTLGNNKVLFCEYLKPNTIIPI